MSKKYNTCYSVAAALIGSAFVNIAMSIVTDTAAMKYLWLLNGFFQSILWSSIIKMLADGIPDDMFPKAIVVISTPPAIGTFLAYGIAAALSSIQASYKVVFLIPAALLTVTGAVWFILSPKADKKSVKSGNARQEKNEKKTAASPAFVLGMIFVLLAAISNGFIKDGVTTWTPSILKERFGMRESVSILITVILPLIAVAGSWFSTKLHKRWKNTSALNTGLYFAETAVLFIAMLSIRSALIKGPVLMLVLFSISAMLMSAVNNILTAIIPLYMRDRAESGLLAGVIDTFCYVGSALSMGVLGYISDKTWNGVFLCLFVFGAAALTVCMISFFNGRKEKYEKVFI